jgi:hypothetical protein
MIQKSKAGQKKKYRSRLNLYGRIKTQLDLGQEWGRISILALDLAFSPGILDAVKRIYTNLKAWMSP